MLASSCCSTYANCAYKLAGNFRQLQLPARARTVFRVFRALIMRQGKAKMYIYRCLFMCT